MQTDIKYWAPDRLDVYYRGMGLQKGDSRDLSNGHWRFIVANFGAPSKFIFHGEVTRKEAPARPLAGGRGGSDARHHRIKLPPEGQYKDLAVVKDEALYPAVSANCRVRKVPILGVSRTKLPILDISVIRQFIETHRRCG